MINRRNQYNLKDSINCYLTYKGNKFLQWADVGDKKTAVKIKEDLIKQGHQAIIRFIDKCFYRVYKIKGA